jgi:hypothetical protein
MARGNKKNNTKRPSTAGEQENGSNSNMADNDADSTMEKEPSTKAEESTKQPPIPDNKEEGKGGAKAEDEAPSYPEKKGVLVEDVPVASSTNEVALSEESQAKLDMLAKLADEAPEDVATSQDVSVSRALSGDIFVPKIHDVSWGFDLKTSKIGGRSILTHHDIMGGLRMRRLYDSNTVKTVQRDINLYLSYIVPGYVDVKKPKVTEFNGRSYVSKEEHAIKEVLDEIPAFKTEMERSDDSLFEVRDHSWDRVNPLSLSFTGSMKAHQRTIEEASLAQYRPDHVTYYPIYTSKRRVSEVSEILTYKYDRYYCRQVGTYLASALYGNHSECLFATDDGKQEPGKRIIRRDVSNVPMEKVPPAHVNGQDLHYWDLYYDHDKMLMCRDTAYLYNRVNTSLSKVRDTLSHVIAGTTPATFQMFRSNITAEAEMKRAAAPGAALTHYQALTSFFAGGENALLELADPPLTTAHLNVSAGFQAVAQLLLTKMDMWESTSLDRLLYYMVSPFMSMNVIDPLNIGALIRNAVKADDFGPTSPLRKLLDDNLVMPEDYGLHPKAKRAGAPDLKSDILDFIRELVGNNVAYDFGTQRITPSLHVINPGGLVPLSQVGSPESIRADCIIHNLGYATKNPLILPILKSDMTKMYNVDGQREDTFLNTMSRPVTPYSPSVDTVLFSAQRDTGRRINQMIYKYTNLLSWVCPVQAAIMPTMKAFSKSLCVTKTLTLMALDAIKACSMVEVYPHKLRGVSSYDPHGTVPVVLSGAFALCMCGVGSNEEHNGMIASKPTPMLIDPSRPTPSQCKFQLRILMNDIISRFFGESIQYLDRLRELYVHMATTFWTISAQSASAAFDDMWEHRYLDHANDRRFCFNPDTGTLPQRAKPFHDPFLARMIRCTSNNMLNRKPQTTCLPDMHSRMIDFMHDQTPRSVVKGVVVSLDPAEEFNHQGLNITKNSSDGSAYDQRHQLHAGVCHTAFNGSGTSISKARTGGDPSIAHMEYNNGLGDRSAYISFRSRLSSSHNDNKRILDVFRHLKLDPYNLTLDRASMESFITKYRTMMEFEDFNSDLSVHDIQTIINAKKSSPTSVRSLVLPDQHVDIVTSYDQYTEETMTINSDIKVALAMNTLHTKLVTEVTPRVMVPLQSGDSHTKIQITTAPFGSDRYFKIDNRNSYVPGFVDELSKARLKPQLSDMKIELIDTCNHLNFLSSMAYSTIDHDIVATETEAEFMQDGRGTWYFEQSLGLPIKIGLNHLLTGRRVATNCPWLPNSDPVVRTYDIMDPGGPVTHQDYPFKSISKAGMAAADPEQDLDSFNHPYVELVSVADSTLEVKPLLYSNIVQEPHIM